MALEELTVHTNGMFLRLNMTKRSKMMRDVRPGPVRKDLMVCFQLVFQAAYPAPPIVTGRMTGASSANASTLLLADAMVIYKLEN